MPASAHIPNHYLYMLKTKQINEASDEYIVILMNTTFTFDIDAHATLVDVTADQLATGNGYTQNSKVLTGVSVVEDDLLDKCTTEWSNPTWAAVGGAIGPTGGAIIYNNRVADKSIAMWLDFGADYTTPDTQSFQIQNIGLYMGMT